MAKRKKLSGKDFMIFIDDKAIALATSHTLTVTAETGDTASKDDGIWDDAEITKMGWEASSESIGSANEGEATDISYEELLDTQILGQEVDLILGIPKNKTDDGLPEEGWQVPGESPNQAYYTGKALITSVTLTGAKGDKSTVSASFKGVGKLKKVPKAVA